jgi:hypothetical protein
VTESSFVRGTVGWMIPMVYVCTLYGEMRITLHRARGPDHLGEAFTKTMSGMSKYGRPF